MVWKPAFGPDPDGSLRVAADFLFFARRRRFLLRPKSR
jgi:hypothetical protein